MMKKLLNTLYVTTEGSYLHKEGETIVVKHEEQIKVRLPIHTIGSICIFGYSTVSPPLMLFCSENGVAISYLTPEGRFCARVEGPVRGNVLLRREQYRKADSESCCYEIARSVLIGKFANSRTVLKRLLRDHGEKVDIDRVERAVSLIGNAIKRLDIEASLDGVRGVEGDAARIYFSVFDNLITSQKEDFTFDERNKRPPLDNVNCMLSFAYTLLMHDVRSAIEAVGLDPAVGFLHRDRPGRYGLALDLMEEFRSFVADRLVLSLINLRKVNAKGFQKSGSGSITMTDDTRKELIVSYQKRKQEEIYHPFLDEKLPLGMLFHAQALLFARYIRGDIDGYPPFLWK